MSSIHRAAHELTQIVKDYCYSYGAKCPDIERLRSVLSGVSDNERYELVSSIRDSFGYTVLTRAGERGHTELCVTLLLSIPLADRLKLILVNKRTALQAAASRGYPETISGILNCLTADQQLNLLFTQNIGGDTALLDAALNGHTEIVKNLLDNLTPEQQLQLLFTQVSDGGTALHYAALNGRTETVMTLSDNLIPEQQL